MASHLTFLRLDMVIHLYRNIPDGKLLYELSRRYGKDCLNDMLGAYTFVWYDRAMNRIELVLDAVGIPRERAVAVGDSANDEDMLRYAGIPVVMGDGDTEMQKVAKYVTCPCLEGGVGDIVEDLMLK